MRTVTPPAPRWRRRATRAAAVAAAVGAALVLSQAASAQSAPDTASPPISGDGARAASPTAHGGALDFSTFVARATASATAVRLAGLDADAAAARERVVTAYLLPRLDASLGVVRHDREIGIALPIPAADPPVFQYRRTVRAAADVRVALFDAEALAERRAAAAAGDAADASVGASQAAAARAAVAVFAAWAEIDAQRSLVAETRDVLAAHRARVEARLAAGDATRIDVDRASAAELDAALAEEDLATAEREVLRAAAALLGVDEPPTLVGALDEAPPPALDEATTRAAAAAAAAARARVGAARAGWAPRVVAEAGAAWTDTPAIDGEHASWDVTAGLQWALFAGRPAEVDAREAAQAAADVRADEAARAARRAWERASDDVAAATRRLELLATRAALADDAAALARVALAEGAISADAALDAELDAYAAEAALEAGRVELARRAWWAALGGSGSP